MAFYSPLSKFESYAVNSDYTWRAFNGTMMVLRR
jgi:hypothetical protein